MRGGRALVAKRLQQRLQGTLMSCPEQRSARRAEQPWVLRLYPCASVSLNATLARYLRGVDKDIYKMVLFADNFQ